MTKKPDELLPSAKDVMAKIALAEAEEASKQAKLHADADAEKKALIDQLSKPSGVSDEEAIARGVKIIERAMKNRMTEVQIYRFPNQLCTDRGRAINQLEPGWEKTLTGVPKEIYQLWDKYFRARGYKLRVQIIDFPGGMPGDIGMTRQLTSRAAATRTGGPRIVTFGGAVSTGGGDEGIQSAAIPIVTRAGEAGVSGARS